MLGAGQWCQQMSMILCENTARLCNVSERTVIRAVKNANYKLIINIWILNE